MNEAHGNVTEQKPDFDGHEKSHSIAPLKIGGLLILIAIGLAVSFLQNLNYLLSTIRLLNGPVWKQLTDPASHAFHAYWSTIIIYEFVTASMFVAGNVAALIFFFQKKRLFPPLIIVSIPLIFILSLVGYYLSGFVPAIAESVDYSQQTHTLIVKFIALHIWIPYFLVSKRVKHTFVN